MYKKTIFVLIISLILSFGIDFSINTAFGEPVTATIASLTVGAALDKLDKTLKDAIAQAGNEIRVSMVVGGGEIRSLITKAKKDYKDILDHTVNTVDKEVIEILGKIENMVNNLLEEVDIRIDKILYGVKEISDSIDHTVISENDPRVIDYMPKAIANINHNKPVSIGFKGKFLNHPLNSLTVIRNGTNIQLPGPKQVVRTERKLVFEIDQKWFDWEEPNKQSDIVAQEFELKLFRENRTWYTLWLAKKPKLSSVSILRIAIIPKYLGKCEVVITTKKEVKITNNRSMNVATPPSGRTGCAQASNAMSPTSDWLFDPGSAHFVQTSCPKARGCSYSLSPSPGSISVLLNACAHHRHRNHMTGVVYATEYKFKETYETQKPISENLSSNGGNIKIELPMDTHSWALDLTGLNNKKISTTSSGANSVAKVKYDKLSRVLLITPVIPTNLFNLPSDF